MPSELEVPGRDWRRSLRDFRCPYVGDTASHSEQHLKALTTMVVLNSVGAGECQIYDQGHLKDGLGHFCGALGVSYRSANAFSCAAIISCVNVNSSLFNSSGAVCCDH